jgi:hypothetical protein
MTESWVSHIGMETQEAIFLTLSSMSKSCCFSWTVYENVESDEIQGYIDVSHGMLISAIQSSWF